MTTMLLLQAKALYANSADTVEELSFAAGDVLTVHERDVAGLAGWWLCSHAGRIGIAPGNRLRLLTASTGDDAVIPGADLRTASKQESTSSTTTTNKAARPATAPLQRAAGNVTSNDSSVQNKVRFTLNVTRQNLTKYVLVTQ